MVTLILERHGQSDGNVLKIFTGHTDLPLTDLGKKQVEKSAEYITENYKIDKIYSSDLTRAMQTAQFVADKTGLEIIKSENLRELFAGEWDGQTFAYVEENFAEDWKIWRNDPGNSRCTGGESMKEISCRVVSELTRIAEENDGKTVFIATHATPVKVAQCHFKNWDVEDIKNLSFSANASLTVVTYDKGKWTIKLESYDEHLGEMRTHLPANV